MTSQIVLRPDLEACVDRAVDNFMAGYGCCQSVVAAFADRYGLDHEMALRVSAGFGGGVGRMRMMCGGVSGLVVLAGLERGQTAGDDRAGKSECYRLVQELCGTFRERNGSIICAQLLKLTPAELEVTPYEASPRTEQYYRQRPCVRKVESAARIFAEMLQASGSL